MKGVLNAHVCIIVQPIRHDSLFAHRCSQGRGQDGRSDSPTPSRGASGIESGSNALATAMLQRRIGALERDVSGLQHAVAAMQVALTAIVAESNTKKVCLAIDAHASLA